MTLTLGALGTTETRRAEALAAVGARADGRGAPRASMRKERATCARGLRKKSRHPDIFRGERAIVRSGTLGDGHAEDHVSGG